VVYVVVCPAVRTLPTLQALFSPYTCGTVKTIHFGGMTFSYCKYISRFQTTHVIPVPPVLIPVPPVLIPVPPVLIPIPPVLIPVPPVLIPVPPPLYHIIEVFRLLVHEPLKKLAHAHKYAL